MERKLKKAEGDIPVSDGHWHRDGDGEELVPTEQRRLFRRGTVKVQGLSL